VDNQFKAGFMHSRLIEVKVEDASGGSELAFALQSDHTVRSFPLPSMEIISKLKELLDTTNESKWYYKGWIQYCFVARFEILSSLLVCVITRVADNKLFLLYFLNIRSRLGRRDPLHLDSILIFYSQSTMTKIVHKKIVSQAVSHFTSSD